MGASRGSIASPGTALAAADSQHTSFFVAVTGCRGSNVARTIGYRQG